MNTGFNDFTNLSSVTKTLCNRLIPTEITAKYIKEHGVIEADQESFLYNLNRSRD